MTEYKTENRLGVGEIVICNKETKGKFESLKYFNGKVLMTVGGGGDKLYIVEEKDRVSSEVNSIQSRGMDTMLKSDLKFVPPSKDSQSLDGYKRGIISNNESSIQDNENNNNVNKRNSFSVPGFSPIEESIEQEKGNNNKNEEKNLLTNENKDQKEKERDNTTKRNDTQIQIQVPEDEMKKKPEEMTSNSRFSNEFIKTKSQIGFSEKDAQIIQIVKGKYHLLKLTSDGKVWGSGKQYFGVVGLGGSACSATTKLLPNLAKVKIVQIAAGMFHSMALSQDGDLYVWGMGFEGQLGLSGPFKVASSPRYLSFFYRKPVKFIACGYNYSLCITNDSQLWGWGENKLGQLGLGKIQIVDKPMQIKILDNPGNQEGCSKSDTLINGPLERYYSGNPLRPCYVASGYSHTAVVTEEGFLVTFGLNIYGQLGLGNTLTSFEPRLIEKDESGDFMEKVAKAACNTSGTFIITESGKMFSCGSGDIGHGEAGVVKLPKLVAGSRIYSHVFCNDNSVVAFGPLRILSVSPNCGPASGNTILSIIGSSFKEFRKLSVRFIFGGAARDVKANFDKLSRTIFVHTPNFLEISPNLELPCQCKIQVTFDGHFFTEYKESFLIYPNSMKITAIDPKCGPTEGKYPLQIKINLDNIPQKYLFSLTVGFQAKPNISDGLSKKKSRKVPVVEGLKIARENLEESKISSDEKNNTIISQLKPETSMVVGPRLINPMDFASIESQLEKANWNCCFSTYENGVMTCKVPKIEHFTQSQVEYNVDVAINGQQFSGYPMIFRFYDIKFEKLQPDISLTDGGLQMKIIGTGLFDSVTKKARIICKNLGERYTDLQWDRTDRTLTVGSVPLHWLTNDEDFAKNFKPDPLFNNFSFEVEITMNNIHWLSTGVYHYCDPKIIRVAYHAFPDSASFDDRMTFLALPQPLTEEEKIFLGVVPPSNDKKKMSDIEKKLKEEDEIINNVYKRPYNGLILYSQFIPQSEMMKVKFAAQTCEYDVIPFYHNDKKVVCLIPEMPKLSPGQHELKILFSLNSQQFVNTGKKILFTSPEFGLKFEEIIKLDELEAKGGKKYGKGKK